MYCSDHKISDLSGFIHGSILGMLICRKSYFQVSIGQSRDSIETWFGPGIYRIWCASKSRPHSVPDASFFLFPFGDWRLCFADDSIVGSCGRAELILCFTKAAALICDR